MRLAVLPAALLLVLAASADLTGDSVDTGSRRQSKDEGPAEQNFTKEHAAKEQAAEEHAEKEHAAKEHAAKEHAAKEHAAKEHAAKEHAAKKHAAKEHAAKQHAAKEPAAAERYERSGQHEPRASATRPPLSQDQAVQRAEAAMDRLADFVGGMQNTSEDAGKLQMFLEDLEAKAASVPLAQQPAALLDAYREAMHAARGKAESLAREAMSAAREVEHAGRKDMDALRKAGAGEAEFEAAYARAERASERLMLRVEHKRDSAEGAIDHLYQAVEAHVETTVGKLEGHIFKRAVRALRGTVLVASRGDSSALAKAQAEHGAAMRDAQSALDGLSAYAEGFRGAARNISKVEQLLDRIAKRGGNGSATEQARLMKAALTAARRSEKRTARGMQSAAQRAARAIKMTGRALEKAQKMAGAKEEEYESAYEHAEDLSEHLRSRAEHKGESAELSIEAMYDVAENHLEADFEESKAKAKAETAEQTQPQKPTGKPARAADSADRRGNATRAGVVSKDDGAENHSEHARGSGRDSGNAPPSSDGLAAAQQAGTVGNALPVALLASAASLGALAMLLSGTSSWRRHTVALERESLG